MTESEALEVLKKPTEHIRAEDDDCIFSSAYARALETAMDALEEVQKYKEIGTVSEFRELNEKATERYSEEDAPDGYGHTCTNKTCAERIRAEAIEEFAKAVVAELEELADYNGNAYLDCADVLEIVRGKE